MKINHLLPLQRIIGKVDNDFNIDQSDWIPRVAAWTIDALAQMKCLPYQWKKRKCEVIDNIARCPNICDVKSVRVYTQNGCLIDRAGSIDISRIKALNEYEDSTSLYGRAPWNEEEIAIFTGSPDVQERLKVGRICSDHGKNFVIIDDDKIEINFAADFIVVEYYTVAKYYDDYFNEEVPFVYDNGDLLEAISWYILYKMLSRGYKHQVFSLTGPEPVNPYVQWTKIKERAAASVKHDLRDSSKNQGWNNFFYNSTFLPRG